MLPRDARLNPELELVTAGVDDVVVISRVVAANRKQLGTSGDKASLRAGEGVRISLADCVDATDEVYSRYYCRRRGKEQPCQCK